MIYYDRIYGEVKIKEPVILELIKCPSLQRLKGIDQAGYFLYFWFPNAKNYQCYSRFEHSLGVFILLKRFNSPFEEQVAGLIHDVSHGVFSHCIDYALNEGSEKDHSHQDNIFEEFVKQSEIPSVLKKYQLDIDYILNEENFPLKEKPLPDLCADRIDYGLRTAFIFKEIDQESVNYFLDNLIVENNRWVFKNFESARGLAKLFFRMNNVYFAGLPSAVMFRTVGDLLKYALEKGYLSKNDLYATDKEVLEKIKENLDKDQRLKLLWERMNNKIKFKNDPKDYNAHVFCKSRVVDPLFKTGGGIKKLSKIEKNWAKIIREETKPKEYFIKFER